VDITASVLMTSLDMAKTKHKKESDKAILASVTKEMQQPRVAKSAQIIGDKLQSAKV
jgi:hypothetical protein